MAPRWLLRGAVATGASCSAFALRQSAFGSQPSSAASLPPSSSSTKLNADFTKRVTVHAAANPWLPSPMAGVERRMLDRIGDEIARATTIVRFAPGSHFSHHTHGGGEEFLVLEGVFQDQYGDFPVGTYVRNPPTTSHTPYTIPGCTILVKLWQMQPDDRNQFAVDTITGALTKGSGNGGVSHGVEDRVYAADHSRPGVRSMLLHEDAHELVTMQQWEPGAHVELPSPAGLELLVVEGSFVESGETFTTMSWLRLPRGDRLVAVAEEKGARVWMKCGHLASDITGPKTAITDPSKA